MVGGQRGGWWVQGLRPWHPPPCPGCRRWTRLRRRPGCRGPSGHPPHPCRCSRCAPKRWPTPCPAPAALLPAAGACLPYAGCAACASSTCVGGRGSRRRSCPPRRRRLRPPPPNRQRPRQARRPRRPMQACSSWRRQSPWAPRRPCSRPAPTRSVAFRTGPRPCRPPQVRPCWSPRCPWPLRRLLPGPRAPYRPTPSCPRRCRREMSDQGACRVRDRRVARASAITAANTPRGEGPLPAVGWASATAFEATTFKARTYSRAYQRTPPPPHPPPPAMSRLYLTLALVAAVLGGCQVRAGRVRWGARIAAGVVPRAQPGPCRPHCPQSGWNVACLLR